MDYTEEYEKRKAIIGKNIEKAMQRVSQAEEKYKKIESDETIDRKEARLEVASKQIQIRKNALKQLEDTLEFLRPITDEDMEYRLRQVNEFSKKIKDIVPDDLNLCFHGSNIMNSKHIIEDGAISSSVDRLGFETSYDAEDQVSVTTKDTIETTINGYAGLIGDYNIPAGCVFVILPKDDAEIESSKSMLIGNVSFKDNPERLYAIITSPENIERVTQWAEKSGIDISKIHDYDGFIQEIENNKSKDTVENKKVYDEFIKSGKVQQQDESNFQINEYGEIIRKSKENQTIEKTISASTGLLKSYFTQSLVKEGISMANITGITSMIKSVNPRKLVSMDRLLNNERQRKQNKAREDELDDHNRENI